MNYNLFSGGEVMGKDDKLDSIIRSMDDCVEFMKKQPRWIDIVEEYEKLNETVEGYKNRVKEEL